MSTVDIYIDSQWVGIGQPDKHYSMSGTSCESHGLRKKLGALELGDHALEAGHAPGDTFDVTFTYGDGERSNVATVRGVLCADGAFELLTGPHEGLGEPSSYLSERLGELLVRLGYTPGQVTVNLDVSPRTFRRRSDPAIVDRTPVRGIFSVS